MEDMGEREGRWGDEVERKDRSSGVGGRPAGYGRISWLAEEEID